MVALHTLAVQGSIVYITSSTDLAEDGAMTNSPQPCDQKSQAVRYYKTDIQGVTYTELRRVLRGWIPFLVMAAVKLLGMHKRLGWGIPHPRDFVLLEPPVRGATAALWAAPVLMLALALGCGWLYLRRMAHLRAASEDAR